MEFCESFMLFRFPDDDAFCIEKDELVRSAHEVKACECIVLLHPDMALIEAKASSPKSISSKAFDDYITSIRDKFADSLRVFNDMRSNKFGEAAFKRLPKNLRTGSVQTDKYILYLIVHGHRLDWLAGLQDAFREALRPILHKWNIADSRVKVFNEILAQGKGLIVAYIPWNERDTVRVSEADRSIDNEKMAAWFRNHA